MPLAPAKGCCVHDPFAWKMLRCGLGWLGRRCRCNDVFSQKASNVMGIVALLTTVHPRNILEPSAQIFPVLFTLDLWIVGHCPANTACCKCFERCKNVRVWLERSCNSQPASICCCNSGCLGTKCGMHFLCSVGVVEKWWEGGPSWCSSVLRCLAILAVGASLRD
jgi:hypothetical protein